MRAFQLVTQLAEIDDDVHDMLKTDVRPVVPWSGEDDEQKVAEKEDGFFFVDAWGIAWKMPKVRGFYYDMISHPLSDARNINDAIDYFKKNPVVLEAPERMRRQAEKYIVDEQKACVLGRSSGGILEMALWLRGYENFFMDLAASPSFAEGLLDIIVDIKCQYWENVLTVVGANAFIISEADDLGTQQGLLISPDMYRKFLKPRHQKLFEFIRNKAATEVYIHYHCCGSIKQLIPDLIVAGVDILNPVQVNARDMDTKELKKLFGKDITFWGGGIDTQRTLPKGTLQEVRDETMRRIEDLAPGGGFVFCPVHCVQGDVPPENYMAMWETFQIYAQY